MATTGFIDGTYMRLSLSDDAGLTKNLVFHVQETSLNFTRSNNEIVTKDTGAGLKWASSQPKTKSGSFSVSGLLRFDETGTNANVRDLFTWFNTEENLDFEFTTSSTGDPIFTGVCRIDDLNINTVADTEASFDATMTLIDNPTLANVV